MAHPLLPIVGIFSFVLFFKMSVLLGYSPICSYNFSVKFAIWGRPIFRQNHGGRVVLSQWLDRTAKVLSFCSCLVFGSSRTSSTGTTGRCDCDCSVVPVVHCADTHTTPSYYPIKHDIEPETLGWKIVFNGVFRVGKSRMIECPAVRLPVVWVKLAKSSRSKLDDHSRVFEKQEHHVDLVCPACSW